MSIAYEDKQEILSAIGFGELDWLKNVTQI